VIKEGEVVNWTEEASHDMKFFVAMMVAHWGFAKGATLCATSYRATLVQLAERLH